MGLPADFMERPFLHSYTKAKFPFSVEEYFHEIVTGCPLVTFAGAVMVTFGVPEPKREVNQPCERPTRCRSPQITTTTKMTRPIIATRLEKKLGRVSSTTGGVCSAIANCWEN